MIRKTLVAGFLGFGLFLGGFMLAPSHWVVSAGPEPFTVAPNRDMIMRRDVLYPARGFATWVWIGEDGQKYCAGEAWVRYAHDEYAPGAARWKPRCLPPPGTYTLYATRKICIAPGICMRRSETTQVGIVVPEKE